jgi:SNF2 family DNA or RNA helicase
MDEKDLHEYQRTAVDHILKNTHCALFLEMGLGKTISTLTAIKKLIYEELEISSVLVVAPKRVAESVWGFEVEKWAHLKGLTVSKIAGNAKQRRQALNVEADIYTLGRDNVAWICGQYGGSMLPFDMLVIDELSSFKSPKSNRFRALKKTQPSFKRVVGLTGTPAPNGIIDIWSQIYLLDRGERLGKFVTGFRERFFTLDPYAHKYTVDKGKEDRIYELIGDICISMKAEDYLDLKKPIENIIRIEFDEATQKMYKDFEREKVLDLLDGPEEGISVANATALSNKLLQFANGAVYDEDKNYHVVHDFKIEALKELVEDANGKPVLIAYGYKHDFERIMEALKKYKPKKLEADQDIIDWNAGKFKVMVMHPASGGHGLNLQGGGNIIIWFSQTWSLELYQQLNARLDRQGQKEVVIIHKLIAVNTIDKRVINSVAKKQDGQEGLMQAVKALVNKYKENFNN